MADLQDYIEDPKLFRAVSLARWLMREQGVAPARANFIAAKKYGFDTTDVAHYTGQLGGRVRAVKLGHEPKRTAKPVTCPECGHKFKA